MKDFSLLTRNMPIKTAIRLLMNNPDEKSSRKKLAFEHKTNEIIASILQAQMDMGQEPCIEKAKKILGVAA